MTRGARIAVDDLIAVFCRNGFAPSDVEPLAQDASFRVICDPRRHDPPS